MNFTNVDIKRAVTELQTELHLNNIDKLRDLKFRNEDVMCTCPVHKQGKENKPSCGVQLEDNEKTKKGTTHCYTCGFVGGFDKFISACFNVDDNGEYGRQWLSKRFNVKEQVIREQVVKEIKPQVEELENYEAVLEKYRFIHPYMKERKLTDEVIELFDIGYDDHFEIKDKNGEVVDIMRCITFPVRDEYGNLKFVARRSVDTKWFHYPHSSEKPVYGLDVILKKNLKSAVVCESFINCLNCWGYGKPAIALMGTGSKEQYEILKRSGIRYYILALDGDDAGDKGKKAFIKNLKDFAFITQYIIPRGKDINDLTETEFNELTEYTTQ